MAATHTTRADTTSALRGGRRWRPLLAVIGFVVSFLLINDIVGEHGAVALMRAHAHNADLTRAVSVAKHENAHLREQAKRLQTDAAAIEEIARRELGLIKPGEKLFILHDVSAGATR
ncbi:MAG: septum formation initiator family protein [Acidobacteriota bacterium]